MRTGTYSNGLIRLVNSHFRKYTSNLAHRKEKKKCFHCEQTGYQGCKKPLLDLREEEENHEAENKNDARPTAVALKSGVPEIAASASPRNLIEMQSLVPTLDLLNHKLWRWGPEICVLTNPPCDSEMGLSLSTTSLEEVERTGGSL